MKRRIFFEAVMKGDLEKVTEMLDNGFDINTTLGYGSNALLRASAEGRLELCKFFLERGLDINSTDDDNWTPLYRACLRGHLNVARFLIANGANPIIKDKVGDSPLRVAHQFSRTNCLLFIAKFGKRLDRDDQHFIGNLRFKVQFGTICE